MPSTKWVTLICLTDFNVVCTLASNAIMVMVGHTPVDRPPAFGAVER
jgi:hypothetical protein